MKLFGSSKWRLRAGLSLAAMAAAICVWSGASVAGADTTSTNAPATVVKKGAAEKKAPKKLTGAELYSINCNRCHPERYPTEFNAAQWKTLMLHMRVRANLPARQAREILKYLQEEASN
jgi:cytochrome c5